MATGGNRCVVENKMASWLSKIIPLEADGNTDMQILDYLINLCLMTLGGVPKVVTDFEAPVAIFKQVFPWEEFELKQAGSIADLLYITKWLNPEDKNDCMYGYNTDIDMLFIPTSVFVSNSETDNPLELAVIEASDFPTFVKLRYNEKCEHKLPSSLLTERDSPGLQNDSKVHYVSSRKILEAIRSRMEENVEITGPSLAIQPHAVTTHLFLTSADRVLAIRNPKWPDLASEWLVRERPNNWPPADVVNEIHSLGSHVVAKGNQLSSESEITWRLSFNMAERVLAEIMTLIQRKCFVTVKTLVKQMKTESVSSYHLKSILWWIIEQGDSSVWTDRSIGHCFLTYIGGVIDTLKTGTVKNYFIPSCNMIQGIDESSLGSLTSKLNDILAKPMSAILSCPVLTENAAELVSKCPDKSYHFHKLEEALPQYSGDEEIRWILLKFFGNQFINHGVALSRDQNMRENGLNLLSIASKVYGSETEQEFVQTHLLNATLIALSMQRSDYSFYLAALLTVVPEDEALSMLFHHGISKSAAATMFHNAGCSFHYWSKVGFWRRQREQYMKNCDKCLTTAIDLDPNHPNHYAEYAYILLVEDRNEESLHFAQNAVTKAESMEKFTYLSFSEGYKEELESTLARHVQYDHPSHDLEIPAIVLAYHVIVLAKKNLGKSAETENITGPYRQVCTDSRNKQPYGSLSVYGYSCMELGLYDEARKAFQQADGIRKNTLQLKNLEMCDREVASVK